MVTLERWVSDYRGWVFVGGYPSQADAEAAIDTIRRHNPKDDLRIVAEDGTLLSASENMRKDPGA